MRLLGWTVGVMTLNVALCFFFVALYAHIIHPHQPDEVYQQFAEVFAPYSSIFTGIPLFYVVGLLLGSDGRLIWGLYAILDILIITAMDGWSFELVVLAVTSQLTKFVATTYGRNHGSGIKRLWYM